MSRRRMRTQVEWKVPHHSPSPTGPSSFSTRARISPAALFVKVTARIESGGMPQPPIRCAMRCVSTRVLPLPAPARTNKGPSVVCTARSCSGFRPAVISSLRFASSVSTASNVGKAWGRSSTQGSEKPLVQTGVYR